MHPSLILPALNATTSPTYSSTTLSSLNTSLSASTPTAPDVGHCDKFYSLPHAPKIAECLKVFDDLPKGEAPVMFYSNPRTEEEERFQLPYIIQNGEYRYP